MPVLLGDYLVLTCSINVHPNSTLSHINWFHNNIIQRRTTTMTYILPGVQLNELGFYKCANTANTIQSEAFELYTEGNYC